MYGSHDLFNGLNFCLGDYVCWSAPVDDLGNWRYEGCIYKREQDPAAPRIRLTNGLAAPDMVQEPDGRFYLYYFMGGTKMISVAVCDEPAGKYEFYGYVKYSDGIPIGKKDEPFQFDPGIFIDDDGRLYLYTGFALAGNPILLDGSKPTEHGAMCFELKIMVDGGLLDFMDVMDVSALFGNMLDNAIESAEKQKEEKRLVGLYISREKQFLKIRTENYCDEKIRFKNGMPVTTKKDKRFHGYGMKSMQKTVEKIRRFCHRQPEK